MFWRSSDDYNDDDNDNSHYDQPDDDYLVASSPAPREKMERNEKKEATTATNPWTAALYDTCTSLGSIYATPEQVMKQSVVEVKTQSFERPKESEIILWNNTEKLVPVMVESYRQREKKEQSAEAASSSSWWLSRVASQVYSTVAVVSSKGEEWTEPGEDYMVGDAEVPWQEPVVDIDLAVTCCQTIVTKAKSTDRQAIVLYREGTAKHCFMGWLRQTEHESILSGNQDDENHEQEEQQRSNAPPSAAQLLLSKLPDDQIQVLLKVFIELNVVRMVDDDVIVVGANSEEDAVSVALFRLDVAMQQIETCIHSWTKQRNSALQQAVRLNEKNNAKALVLTQLRRKQLYDSNIQQAHGTLLNLQQTKLAVETAQSQASVTQVLSETAVTLKQLHDYGGLTVELVDDLKDDLLEEYDHLQIVHDSLTQQQHQSGGDDDASLLSELEALMIADDLAPLAPSVTMKAEEDRAGLPSKDEGEEKGRDPPLTNVAFRSPPAH